MDSVKLSSSAYFKSLQIVHLALMAGVAFFAVISFVLISSGRLMTEDKETDAVLRYVVPVFVIVGITASTLIYKQRLKECLQQPGLKGKLDFYRGTLIVRYALVEGPAFFAIIAFMLTGNLFYLGMAGILLIVLLVNRPTIEKAITDLELDHEDRELLNNPDAVI